MEKSYQNMNAENRTAKYLKYLCGHGKYKYQCKECKGSQICPHSRRKSECKECGGSQICPHNRQKQTCKDCGGAKICRHNRQKNQCKDCGGSQICPHNRQKAHCKECKGPQICPHNRQKSRCRECGGSQICPHNREKNHCKKCCDPIKISIEQWIFSRRQYDKMRNIYDADRFIDKCFLKDSLKTTNNVITEIAKSTSNIQNIKMILRQSRDLIIRLGISRATVFCAA